MLVANVKDDERFGRRSGEVVDGVEGPKSAESRALYIWTEGRRPWPWPGAPVEKTLILSRDELVDWHSTALPRARGAFALGVCRYIKAAPSSRWPFTTARTLHFAKHQ